MMATPDPVKLLDTWMEWERGEVGPGRVMSNLKTAGLRDVLEGLADVSRSNKPQTSDDLIEEGLVAEAVWTPTV